MYNDERCAQCIQVDDIALCGSKQLAGGPIEYEPYCLDHSENRSQALSLGYTSAFPKSGKRGGPGGYAGRFRMIDQNKAATTTTPRRRIG